MFHRESAVRDLRVLRRDRWRLRRSCPGNLRRCRCAGRPLRRCHLNRARDRRARHRLRMIRGRRGKSPCHCRRSSHDGRPRPHAHRYCRRPRTRSRPTIRHWPMIRRRHQMKLRRSRMIRRPRRSRCLRRWQRRRSPQRTSRQLPGFPGQLPEPGVPTVRPLPAREKRFVDSLSSWQRTSAGAKSNPPASQNVPKLS